MPAPFLSLRNNWTMRGRDGWEKGENECYFTGSGQCRPIAIRTVRTAETTWLNCTHLRHLFGAVLRACDDDVNMSFCNELTKERMRVFPADILAIMLYGSTSLQKSKSKDRSNNED